MIAFVLGGGGRLGAAQVGMLDALVSRGVTPDLILGTSIGAINGAVFASSPDEEGVRRLHEMWSGPGLTSVLSAGVVDRLRTLAATRVALHRSGDLAAVFDGEIDPDARIEDLRVPFGCVAACIETAAAAWFTEGLLTPALLASCAVPGLFEPVEIDGRHHLDGGLVDSIPVRKAIDRGATTVHVLQVGRIEQPLTVPTNPLEVAQISFEIARRHGFMTALEEVGDDVTIHVLPSGGAAPAPTDLRANLSYRDLGDVEQTIEAARAATATYLDGTGHAGDGASAWTGLDGRGAPDPLDREDD